MLHKSTLSILLLRLVVLETAYSYLQMEEGRTNDIGRALGNVQTFIYHVKVI